MAPQWPLPWPERATSRGTPRRNGSHFLQVTCPIPWKFLTVETFLLITNLSLLIQLMAQGLKDYVLIKGAIHGKRLRSPTHSGIHSFIQKYLRGNCHVSGTIMDAKDEGHFLTLL